MGPVNIFENLKLVGFSSKLLAVPYFSDSRVKLAHGFKVWNRMTIHSIDCDSGGRILNILKVIMLLNLVKSLMSKPNVLELIQLLNLNSHLHQQVRLVIFLLLCNRFFYVIVFRIYYVGIAWLSTFGNINAFPCPFDHCLNVY